MGGTRHADQRTFRFDKNRQERRQEQRVPVVANGPDFQNIEELRDQCFRDGDGITIGERDDATPVDGTTLKDVAAPLANPPE